MMACPTRRCGDASPSRRSRGASERLINQIGALYEVTVPQPIALPSIRMSRETPQAAFEHAQAAMLRGDLLEVFACLDVNDLKRVAANAVALSLGAHDDADEQV